MEQGIVFEICGVVASVGMILGYLPQAVKTIRTRNTDGIALPTFLMMAVGGFAFMLQGLLHKPDIIWSLFLTNLVTTSCSCIVFSIKIYNDYFRKELWTGEHLQITAMSIPVEERSARKCTKGSTNSSWWSKGSRRSSRERVRRR